VRCVFYRIRCLYTGLLAVHLTHELPVIVVISEVPPVLRSVAVIADDKNSCRRGGGILVCRSRVCKAAIFPFAAPGLVNVSGSEAGETVN